MASLEKLAIRGIRSFDDKELSIIQFYSPVTVIVGHNGSGKTTIIECLKYATTGDQPPNTRGGAFIHDPKIANEKEVKAQVKLRFFAANRSKMLAIRNLSVTAKKTGMTMKTLESILAHDDYDRKSKRGVISTKCADLDKEIPELLGVSKSVLENVIFCHQEDSYWPLAEASVLKKKFDDIFEATKYTKALNSIKDLRKERVAELKAERERLAGLQVEKAHADKLSGRIDSLKKALSQKETEHEELAEAITQTTSENKAFFDSATAFKQIYITVDALEKRKEQLSVDIEQQEIGMQILNDTDEELESRVREFDRHAGEKKRTRERIYTALQREEERLADGRKEHVQESMKQGNLQAEASNHDKNIRSREEFVREVAERFNLKGFNNTPLANERMADFARRLNELMSKQRSDMDLIVQDGKARSDELSGRLQALRHERDQYSIERTQNLQLIKKHEAAIQSHSSKSSLSQTLDAELKFSAEEFTEISQRLDKAQAAFKNASYDTKITEKSAEIRRLDEEKDQINSVLRSLSLQADSRAKLGLKRAEHTKKRREINLIVEGNGPKFLKLTGTEATEKTMEREIDEAIGLKEKEISSMESDAVRFNRDLHQVETSISSLKSQQKTKANEEKRLRQEIQQVLAGDGDEQFSDVSEALADAQNQLQELREDTKNHALYKKFLTSSQKSHNCSLCDRKLNEQEMTKFENKLNKVLTKLSEQASTDDIKQWEDEVVRLQTFLPKEANCTKLEQELPQLKKQIQEEEAKLDAASKAVETTNDKVKALKTDLRDLQHLKTQAVSVTRNLEEISRLLREIADLERDLESSGTKETVDELQAQLNKVSERLRGTESERQTLISSRDHETKAQRALMDERHKVELDRRDLENKVNERNALLETIEGLKREIASLNERAKDLESKIQGTEPGIQQLDEELRKHQAQLGTQIEKGSQQAQEFTKAIDTLTNMTKVIERYTRDRRDRELKACEERITDLEEQIGSLKDIVEQKRTELAAVEKEINEGGATLARFRDNLRLRKLKSDLENVVAEIEQLDMRGAAKARAKFDEKWPKMEKKLNDMKDQFARLGGEMSTERVHLESAEKDLAHDFKNIHKRYKEQLIKVKLSDMANNDLEKYGKALDNAIMKYHSLKMEEVNETMRELWNKTYQGTDIDGIAIRSDNEGSTTKRTYNYRVVMTKDQVEMDMRGRCSAGQKMLASIIIRLALSDSFGQNCGILALDEPTNALDSENIDALAESLVDIIRERKAVSNFQLIIITHDEKFLQKLGEAEVMEYYWRVSRDRKQKSKIERQRFGIDHT